MPAAARWNLRIHNRCLFIRMPSRDERGASVATSPELRDGPLDPDRIQKLEEAFV